MSDGRFVLELLWGRTEIVSLQAVTSLLAVARELRPREWDAYLVALAFAAPVDSRHLRGIEPALQYLKYQRYADTWDVQNARKALNWILRQELRASDRFAWQWEAVWFLAFQVRDAAAARAQQLVAEDTTDVTDRRSCELRARAALAACEGRREEALISARAAFSSIALEPGTPAALINATRNDLIQLFPELAAEAAAVDPAEE